MLRHEPSITDGLNNQTRMAIRPVSASRLTNVTKGADFDRACAIPSALRISLQLAGWYFQSRRLAVIGHGSDESDDTATREAAATPRPRPGPTCRTGLGAGSD